MDWLSFDFVAIEIAIGIGVEFFLPPGLIFLLDTKAASMRVSCSFDSENDPDSDLD